MFKKSFLFMTAAFCLSFSAAKADIAVNQDAVKSLNVTVYNNGLGLVKDSRSVNLNKGENALSFYGVSAQMQPETALLQGDGLKVREQNFNFDLLSRESLLRKFMGKDIQVIDTHYLSGKKTIENAKVLSVDAGLVLKIGDRIETDYSGRLIFPNIPEDLYDQPTLTINIDAAEAGNRDVQLSYLTNGMTWRADYVAELNAAEDALNLNGWVTLTNTSGIAYRNADIQFVAGAVNRVRPVLPRPRMKAAKATNMLMATMDAAPMQEEELMDYHLYSLGRKTDIASNQTKQLALLSAGHIKVRKEYKFSDIAPSYRRSSPSGEFPRRDAQIELQFDNDKASNIGLPLPAGIVRVYKADRRDRMFFVGEDNIQHTPENTSVKLNLGTAFDVTAEGKETAFTAFSDKAYEAGYSLTFKNAKDIPVRVTYRQNLPNQWTITDSSLPYKKQTSGQAQWSVDVAAKGETVLNFTVRVTKP